jgi:hypothetical protein
MRRRHIETTISEGLLTALDDCLDAMLSGATGMEEGQRACPELSTELEPLLAVAFELMRSRERIDQRLAPWREGLPMMEYVTDSSDAFVSAGRWPGLN